MTFTVDRSERIFNGEPIYWLTADNMTAMGMEDCGCGQFRHRIAYRIVRQHDGVISYAFWHPRGVTCRMAFDAADFHPLTFEEYLVALGQEVEEEV